MSFFQSRSYIKSLLVFSFFIVLTSCAAPQRTKLDQGLLLGTDSKIEVGTITTADQKKYDVDAESLLRNALEKALLEKGILRSKGTNEKYFTLSANITDYEMGNAFKRWLLPFYGATILKVECEITDSSKGVSVTKFEHRQSIVVGGLYTVGGWKTIFDTVARDIAADLERRTTDKAEGFYVELAPWPENEVDIPKAAVSQKINLVPLKDQRPDKTRIGERLAAFEVSMGNVYLNRDAASYLSEALQNDLLASGNQLTSSGYNVILEGEITKFWVSTNTTPLYWDVIGEIEVKLSVTDSSGTKGKIEKTYTAQSTSRTYAWPTQKVVSQVLSASVKNLMYDIRNDSIWIKN
ncbi:MAG: DUF4410 domain-containing protein [Deltaproteobacteria bacterium]|nr:DUF4410 domain-containing protein [Deltaproteobacteria bacterium]